MEQKRKKKPHTHANTKTRKNKVDGSYSEKVRTKWFCCTFKLGFLELIRKPSLIFKLNLELALSIIINEIRREIRPWFLERVLMSDEVTIFVYWDSCIARL